MMTMKVPQFITYEPMDHIHPHCPHSPYSSVEKTKTHTYMRSKKIGCLDSLITVLTTRGLKPGVLRLSKFSEAVPDKMFYFSVYFVVGYN